MDIEWMRELTVPKYEGFNPWVKHFADVDDFYIEIQESGLNRNFSCLALLVDYDSNKVYHSQYKNIKEAKTMTERKLLKHINKKKFIKFDGVQNEF